MSKAVRARIVVPSLRNTELWILKGIGCWLRLQLGSKWKPRRQRLTSLNILIKTNLPTTRLAQLGLGVSYRLSLISFTFSRNEEATLGVYEISSFCLSLKKKKSYSDFLASNWHHCRQFFKLDSTPSGPKHCSPAAFCTYAVTLKTFKQPFGGHFKFQNLQHFAVCWLYISVLLQIWNFVDIYFRVLTNFSF